MIPNILSFFFIADLENELRSIRNASIFDKMTVEKCFITWLSRVVLKKASVLEKSKFRNLENWTVKLVKVEQHLSFNQQCIDLNLLLTLGVLLEEGSVTGAAQRLGVTQPAVSAIASPQ